MTDRAVCVSCHEHAAPRPPATEPATEPTEDLIEKLSEVPFDAWCNGIEGDDTLVVGEWCAAAVGALRASQATVSRLRAENEQLTRERDTAADNFDMMTKTWGEERATSTRYWSALKAIADAAPVHNGEEFTSIIDRLQLLARRSLTQTPTPEAKP